MVVEYVCETCGKKGKRCYSADSIPSHFFCSRECQNEWQKTRKDIVLRNKDPEFRKKVSAGLKNRKKMLGENYHSPETKKKIGEATASRWGEYEDEKRQRMLGVLRENAQNRRTYSPYDFEWHQISSRLRTDARCQRCGTKDGLVVHHIIPTKAGGTREPRNLVVLCRGCHTTVEYAQKSVYEIISDWRAVQILVRECLYIYD